MIKKYLFNNFLQLDLFSFLVDPIIRKKFKFNQTSSSAVIIKVADHISEIDQSIRIVNQCYKHLGFIDPSMEVNEINKYQLLPHATIIVAKVGEKVVGTLTLVKRFGFGLPMEEVFQLGEDLNPGNAVSEITCLAIDKKFRRTQGQNVLLLLFKFMYQFSVQYFHVNKIFLVCLPQHHFFYRALFGFKKISGKSFVADYKDAPALALVLDLHDAYSKMKKWYRNPDPAQNLFHFFVNQKMDCFKFPDFEYFKTTDLCWDGEKLEHLLTSGRFQLPKLSMDEMRRMKNLYLKHPLQSFFKVKYYANDQRAFRRFSSALRLNLETKLTAIKMDAFSISISLASLLVRTERVLSAGEEYVVNVEIGPGETSRFSAKVLMVKNSANWYEAVLVIIEPDLYWLTYLNFLSV